MSRRVFGALTLIGVTLGACTLDREGRLASNAGTSSGGSSSAGGEASAVGGSSAGGSSDGGGGAGAGGTAGAGGAPDCVGDDRCANPACAGVYECAPEVPTGFSGPFHVRSVAADPAPTAQTCDDGDAPDVFFRGLGDPATCTACSCDDAAASCSLPTVRYYSDQSDCGGSSSVITPDGTCQAFNDTCNNCNRARSMQLETPSQGQGSCTPSGGTAQLPPMWKLENHLCAAGADAGGCPAVGDVCIPTGTGAYASPPCITQAGDQTCPIEYSEKYTIYTGGTDTRACSSCGCDSPTCTAGTFTLYDEAGCALGGENPLDIVAACSMDIRSWVDESAASYEAAAGALQGCAATGGTPVGSVAGDVETTLCCTGPIVDR